jgi:hypothetical protein
MELTLHTCLDKRLETEYPGSPVLLRYVDNLTYISRTEHEGQQVLETTETTLAESGLHLKKQDGPPQDIRGEYNRTVLGLIPRWRDGQLTFAIPESGFDDLREGFINALNTSRPAVTARAVAKGWINSIGPALTKAVMPSVIERAITIAQECGFTELRAANLQDTGERARKRWLDLCVGGGGVRG